MKNLIFIVANLSFVDQNFKTNQKMKKIKLLFAAFTLVMLFTGASFAQNTNENSYKGKAQGLLHSCIQEAHQAGYIVNSYVTYDNSSCLNAVTVHFYGTPNCPPNSICPQVIYPIGSVTFDCNGEAVVINCESGSTL